MICRNPANGISHTKLRLGVHHSRIQTGKYEIKGAQAFHGARLSFVFLPFHPSLVCCRGSAVQRILLFYPLTLRVS